MSFKFDNRGVNFALKLWNITTIVVEVFGGILVLRSFLGLRKETRELMKMDDGEFIPEEVTSNLIHYFNLRIKGIIITAISGLVRIFMR